ncbi:MAG TPA: nucleotidyltransferase family protein [Terriglobales bacterium]|nr:nucleotidyltransferase family protein [Terriglobales bacterium]
MAAAAEIRPVVSDAQSRSGIRPFTDDSEFDLLLACCADSSSDEHTKRIGALLSCRLNWKRLLALVDHHRVVPQVYGELSAYSHLVPTQHLDALRSRYQNNARKTLWFTAELIRIVGHLESAGIKVLPYKGPVLAQTLYGEVTQRQFGDLDLLIHPADVPKAKGALRDLGYKPGIELAPQIEDVYIKTGYECSFSSTIGQYLLELQWRIVPRFYSIDFNVADFLDRADKIDIGGRPMRTLRPEDLLLVLCVHAAKHMWVQLSWLRDIAQLTRSERLDWRAIQHEARRLGIERIVNLNLLLAHKLLGSLSPHGGLKEETQTNVLANEILRIMKRSDHYNTESLPYFRLMMRLRERRQDRIRFLYRLATTPSLSEWTTVRFPKPLHPLYRLVRLWRLAKRLASDS